MAHFFSLIKEPGNEGYTLSQILSQLQHLFVKGIRIDIAYRFTVDLLQLDPPIPLGRDEVKI